MQNFNQEEAGSLIEYQEDVMIQEGPLEEVGHQAEEGIVEDPTLDLTPDDLIFIYLQNIS